MKMKKLAMSLACAGLAVSPTTWAAGFPGAGVDDVSSLAKFNVTFTEKNLTRDGDRSDNECMDGESDVQCFERFFSNLPMMPITPEQPLDDETSLNTSEGTCQLYGVNDGGLNNSQLFTVNPDTHEVKKLGSLYEGKDIEALAAHPTTGVLYAASGDDTDGDGQDGHLYTVKTETGELTDKGYTGFDEIEGLTFDSNGTLWAWAKDDGLITINTQSGVGTMEKEFPGVLIEDLTWNNAGTHIYASENTNLWVYEHATKTAKLACSNLPGETEALEMLPDGTLLLGIHGAKKIIQFQALNVETCEIVFGVDIPTLPGINDVEGIAWPEQACSTGGAQAQEEQAQTQEEASAKWVLWDGKNIEGSFKALVGTMQTDTAGKAVDCKLKGEEDGIIFSADENGNVEDSTMVGGDGGSLWKQEGGYYGRTEDYWYEYDYWGELVIDGRLGNCMRFDELVEY